MSRHFHLTRRQALHTLGALSLSPAALAADPFPTRPIKIIVPFPPASTTDFLARLLADALADQMKQAVTVENRPGAGGVIGTQQLARSTADGYTLGICSLATFAMVPATLKEPLYDVTRDFSPVSALISTDLVMATSMSVPATLREFTAWASAQSKPVFLGTLGAGTSGHFAGFMFGKAANIKWEPIHYRTNGEVIAALMAGDIHAVFTGPSVVQPQVKAGKLRALALVGDKRSAAYPEVPTFVEQGYKDMQFSNWIGIAAPAKVPADVLDKLHAEIMRAMNQPQVRNKLLEGGYTIIANRRDEFVDLVRKDAAMWADMVKVTGFKV
ncbi:MAG TPA: tripartite tricarboxylate transporter substrate binding protein [Ramlibacter sp.]|nr:tripartite tricarboxylate transporter substrate binding protein [Ramlibacter sp.]